MSSCGSMSESCDDDCLGITQYGSTVCMGMALVGLHHACT